MNYIIIGKYGIPSIKKIISQLTSCLVIKKFDIRNGYIWKALYQNKWENYTRLNNDPNFTSNDKILRWGCCTPLYFNGAKVYNNSKGINLASNKYKARMKMKECGVPIPKTSLNYRDFAIYTSVVSYPYIIARPFKHHGGKNFYILKNNNDYNNFSFYPRNFYYSEVYNKNREIRVHIAHGKILSIQEKPLIEGIIQANQAQTHEPWNVVRWNDYKKNICKIACDTVKVLGLDYGAVDIMLNNSNREMPICVCEVNTCPSLDSSPYDQHRYAQYINWLFMKNREWYDYTQWNAGKSFAFKNEQLGN